MVNHLRWRLLLNSFFLIIIISGCKTSTTDAPATAKNSGLLIYMEQVSSKSQTFDLASGTVTSGFPANDPTWTPSGLVLFEIPYGNFNHHNSGAMGIADVKGNNEKDVADIGMAALDFYMHPQISHDGLHVSFNYFDGFDPSGNPYSQISGTTIIAPDGTFQGGARSAFDGSWAPDGSMILSGSSLADPASSTVRTPVQAGLYKLDNTFQHLTRVDDGTVPQPVNPAVSPDGTKIAFSSNDHIWMMNIDGTNPHQVTTGSFYEQYVNWSPDSKNLVIHCRATFTFGEGFGAVILPASTTNLTLSATGPYWVTLNGGTADNGDRIKPLRWINWK